MWLISSLFVPCNVRIHVFSVQSVNGNPSDIVYIYGCFRPNVSVDAYSDHSDVDRLCRNSHNDTLLGE